MPAATISLLFFDAGAPGSDRRFRITVKEIIHLPRGILVHRRAGPELLEPGHSDMVNVSEPPHKCLLPYFTDSLDVVEQRADLLLLPERAVVADGETVHLVLDARKKLEGLAVLRDR